MPSFLVGSAYAVSAGLIIYSIERGFITGADAPRFLIGWAAAGLVLAGLAIILRRPEK